MRQIPLAALVLGALGALPFVWAAALVAGYAPTWRWMPAALSGDGRIIMLRYGTIILPFMSGAIWGFAAKVDGARRTAGLALSVLPALWVFFAPGTGPTSALINLMTGFAGVLMIELAFRNWQMTPPWWLSLRLPLTFVVLGCLIIGLTA